MLLIRRRARTGCVWLRVMFTFCAACSVLSFYLSWVQLVVFNARADDGNTAAYLREMTAREELCARDMSAQHNTSSLFSSMCSIDTNLLTGSHRLALNWTCSHTFLDLTLNQADRKERGRTSEKSAGTRITVKVSQVDDPPNSTCKGRVLVSSDSPAYSVPFGDPCLKQYIQERCQDGHSVPRLVHYVWFSQHTMDVVTLLSVLAAYRFLDPCLILFHSDSLPSGPHWRALLGLVPVLVRVQRVAPSVVFGRKLGVVQHKSDIARLEALKEYGGIYLDGDQVVLRSLDEFRDYEFVMGHENKHNLANSLLISVPNAKFIDVWYRNYRSYNPRQWGIHSTFLPLALAKIYPKTIHNAGYAFIKPDLPGVREIWEGHYDWRENHAVHLYYRSMVEGKDIRTNYTLQELTRLNSTLGEISRHIVFGSKDACYRGVGLPGENRLK
ncbi:uncharacterized protein [Littorina saxatilis]|uniref:Uncharacterized protein n=1 Tax=Littorina saxatilis TaxID=31220 RepID=A0AAN9B357_9CAEN